MKDAETLLRLLTERVPPTAPAAHGLVFRDGALRLTLFVGDRWVTFTIDDGDFTRPVEDIAADVVRLLTPGDAP